MIHLTGPFPSDDHFFSFSGFIRNKKCNNVKTVPNFLLSKAVNFYKRLIYKFPDRLESIVEY